MAEAKNRQLFTKARGMISLEAALVLPLALTFLLLLQVALSCQEAIHIYHVAAEEASREMELAVVFKGLIPWSHFKRPVKFKLPEELEDFLVEEIGTAIGAQAIRLRTRKLFREKLPHRPFLRGLLKGAEGATLRRGEHCWEYSVQTEWGRGLYLQRIEIREVIPDFSLYPFELGDYEGDEEGESDGRGAIWDEHNFVRGRYFNEKYGANLPFNFPYLSSFEQGTTTKILSVDLTAPGWEDPVKFQKRLHQDLLKMANYQGQPTPYAGVTIPSEAIQRRVLHYVIPENAESWQKEGLKELRRSAGALGVEIQVTEEEPSHRYRDAEGSPQPEDSD